MTCNVDAPNWDGVPEGAIVPVFDEKGVLQKLTYVVTELVAESADEAESVEVEL